MTIEMMKYDCFQEGRKENQNETALRMLQENLSEALIAKCTGLTLDEVQVLARHLK